MASLPFNLDSVDWKKIGKGFLIAIMGAVMTYISEIFVDFGWATPLAVTGWSTVINLFRKLIADNTKG